MEWFLLFFSSLMHAVQVYHQQLYGKGFVWVLPGWYNNEWWRKDKLVEGCTFDQLETAVVESMYISVEASNFTTSPDDDLIAGIVRNCHIYNTISNKLIIFFSFLVQINRSSNLLCKI